MKTTTPSTTSVYAALLLLLVLVASQTTAWAQPQLAYPVAAGTTDTTCATCNAPSGRTVSNITSNSARLQWRSVSCAVAYDLQYRRKGTTAWSTLYMPGRSSTSRVVSGLLGGTTYQRRLRSYCSTAPDTLSSNYVAGPDFPLALPLPAYLSKRGTCGWAAGPPTGYMRQSKLPMAAIL